jgi:hypothetical protein
MDTTRFAAKVFAVTVHGISWTGETVAVTVEVATHGDAKQAEYVVLRDNFPTNVRKVERFETVRLS